MSGGAYDYSYRKAADMSEAMLSRDDLTSAQHEFAAHLNTVAEVMRAVEWAHSGDTSIEDADTAIRNLLGDRKRDAGIRAQLVAALERAEEWMAEDGCDCCQDAPGTCALCVGRAALAAAKRGEG